MGLGLETCATKPTVTTGNRLDTAKLPAPVTSVRPRGPYCPELASRPLLLKRDALYCLRMRPVWTRRALIATVSLLPRRALAQDADDLLYNRVLRKLNNDRSLRIRDLTVTVVDGVVTINGTVRTERLKQRAKKVASVKGVKKVVNELRIGA